MNRLNRRRFLALGAASTASAVLVACGNEAPSEEEMNPTQIPDVAGAPPTLAPITSTPSAEQGGGEGGGEEQATGGEGGGGAAEALTIVTLDSLAFDPSEAEVSPGQTITVENDGFLQHDLAVDEWGGQMVPLLNNGETADFTIPEDAEVGAQFVFYCTVPGHREGGMEGTFTIVEAGAATGSGEEQAAAAGTPEEEAAASGIVELEAGDIYYDKTELELAPGQTLVMHNVGMLQHDFVIEDWDNEEVIPLLNGGETGEWTVPDDVEVGSTVTYYCSVPGHRQAGMEGQLTFVEAAVGGGEEQAAATSEEAASTPAEAEGTPAATGDQGTPAAAGDASDPTNVTVVATEWTFAPADFEVVPGGKITLVNEGTVSHGMAAESLGGTFLGPIRAGGTGEFRLPTDLTPGDTIEYTAVNSSASDLGMRGTITIVEGEAGAAASPAASPMASPVASPEAAATPVADGGAAEALTIVTLDSMAFDPSELDVSPGQTLTLQNDGFLPHDIAVDAWGGQLTPTLNSGDTAEFTIPEDAAVGESFEYYCTEPGHAAAGMVGTFTIVEG